MHSFSTHQPFWMTSALGLGMGSPFPSRRIVPSGACWKEGGYLFPPYSMHSSSERTQWTLSMQRPARKAMRKGFVITRQRCEMKRSLLQSTTWIVAWQKAFCEKSSSPKQAASAS